MQLEIIDLVKEPQAIIVALFIGAIVGVTIERVRANLRRRAWKERNRWRPQSGQLASSNTKIGQWNQKAEIAKPLTDAAEQLRIVMGATFSVQPLLNRSEARVFRELEAVVSACNPRWLVMAQVSLGEILKSQNSEAYSCINSKRVDLLLVDENCRPRHVIEYQGGAHHQGAAAARDAVKKEALRRAGIGYHEVVAGQTTPADLRRLVTKLIEQPVALTPAMDAASTHQTQSAMLP